MISLEALPTDTSVEPKMSDLEMTKLCAKAMGFYFAGDWSKHSPSKTGTSVAVQKLKTSNFSDYDPLNDDAQAMALVKRFRLRVFGASPPYNKPAVHWIVEQGGNRAHVQHPDLNRAIVECVAKMQKAKGE